MGVTTSSEPVDQSTQLRPTGQVPVSSGRTDHPNPAGRDINITWWYTFLSIAGISVLLLGLAATVSTSLITELNEPSWQIVLILGLFIGSAISSVYASWLIRDGYGAGWPKTPVSILLLVVPILTWAITIFIPGATLYGAVPLWITLSIMLPLVKRRQRLGLTAVGLVLIVLHGALNSGTEAFIEGRLLFGIVLLVVLTPSTFLFSGWLWHLITRLDEARTIGSQLAVARERLRFASDLHDIQGHHLQVIALKAELADRLLVSDSAGHQATAKQAIGEVRSLAEQAQLETRQLVRDLRVVSLHDEVENAKGVLEAADITTEVTIDADTVASHSTDTNRLLGLAVREATTNILRHANAQHVTITLTAHHDLQLDIRNDGTDASGNQAEPAEGTGLNGLQHRFHKAGGNVTTDTHEDIFRLRATLPNNMEVDET